jgi:hypothetical protein
MSPKKLPPKFDGDYLNTVFMVDQDSKAFQMNVEPNGGASFDLTVAVLDKNNKRTEYVLTATGVQLKVLVGLIQNALKAMANTK